MQEPKETTDGDNLKSFNIIIISFNVSLKGTEFLFHKCPNKNIQRCFYFISS